MASLAGQRALKPAVMNEGKKLGLRRAHILHDGSVIRSGHILSKAMSGVLMATSTC